MTPDQVTTAITDALNHGGETWLVGTIVALLPALWTASLILHLGRPYIVRTLRRMGLRLGADGWWMTYLILRDAVLLITLGLSLIFFQPNLVANSDLPITGPLSALFLLLALAVKLWRRVDDDVTAYRLSTAFLVLGATIYYFAVVFAVEGGDQSYLSTVAQWFTSSSNSTVALDIMWGSLPAVIIVAGALFMWALNRAAKTMQRRFTPDRAAQTPDSRPLAK
jgi:putative Ca2+/H+ antiporter (TMEM165/GDT1 family)